MQQALTLLGTKPLKMLVLGFSLPGQLFAGIGSAALGYYWRHALTKAVAAREVCETLWQQPGDEAFLAGLLQDLGILVLLKELGKSYAKFLDRVLAQGGDLAAMEVQALGFDHVQLSARLLVQWGLPPLLTDAVAWRHGPADSPSPGPPPRLAEVLRLAEWIARLLADRQTETLGCLLDGAARQGLEPTRLEEIVQRLEKKVQQLADVLSLQLPGGWNYRDLLQRAHEQLANVAADAVGDLFMQRCPPTTPGVDSQSLLDEFQELAAAAARVAHRPAPPPQRRPVSDSPDPDLALTAALTAAATACRQSRCPLSLLLVELDHREESLSRVGSEALGQLRRFVESACRGVDHPGAICLPHGDTGFALVLPDCDRGPAARLGNQLIDEVRRLTPGRGPDGRSAVSISVGAATVSLPPKNFPPCDLLVAAARCLSGSRTSGGGVLKSIEIY